MANQAVAYSSYVAFDVKYKKPKYNSVKENVLYFSSLTLSTEEENVKFSFISCCVGWIFG